MANQIDEEVDKIEWDGKLMNGDTERNDRGRLRRTKLLEEVNQ